MAVTAVPLACEPAIAAEWELAQDVNDTPMHFPQRNTYGGGIQDCTGDGSCETSDSGDDGDDGDDGGEDGDEASVCGGGNLPGQYCTDEPLSASARDLVSHGVTLADAIKCNTAFTVAGIFKSNGDDEGQLASIPDSVGGQNRDLWDVIWHLSPIVQKAPAANKEGYFIRARDTPIQDAIPVYRENLKMLANDYNYCARKGVASGGR